MRKEAKKKNRYIPTPKLTKQQEDIVREEIQTICKELGWLQFSSFEELADMLCLSNGDYIKLAVDKLRKQNEILLQVWCRDLFISVVPNTWFYTRFVGDDIDKYIERRKNNEL